MRDEFDPHTPKESFIALRLSWCLVCKCYLQWQRALECYETGAELRPYPKRLTPMATTYEYVDHMDGHRQPVSVTDSAVSLYSVDQVILAGNQLCEALDAFGWTSTGGAYLEALYLRYCCIIQDPGKHAQEDLGQWVGRLPRNHDPKKAARLVDSDEEYDVAVLEDEEELNTPLEDGKEPVYHSEDLFLPPPVPPAEPLLHPAPVHSGFLDVGERLFFHHMWWHWSLQSLASKVMLSRPLPLKLYQLRAQWRLEYGLPQFKQILLFLLNDRMFGRENTLTPLSLFYPNRLLWPGEREQLMFTYTN